MSPGDSVVVARIGRPHGIRGEVSLELRTDEPERRLARGATVVVEHPRGAAPGLPSTLTVAGSRWHQERLLVSFDGVADRTTAEGLRNCLLSVEVAPEERPEDPEEFYDHQLVGLAVHPVGGDRVGEVAEVLHSGAQDVLVVRRAGVSVVLNAGTYPAALPEGEVLISSGPLPGGVLPPDTAAWIR